MIRLYSVCILLVVVTCRVSNPYGSNSYGIALSDEKRLLKHLLSNYERVGKDGRPTYNTSEPIKVNISCGLIELSEFNIDNQEIMLVGWTALKWTDVLLKWDSDDFSELDRVTFSPDRIWTPAIILTNALSQPEMIHETRVSVTSEGKVKWVNTYKYHFYCKIPSDDVDADSFQCHMTFGSWSMSSDLLLLQNSGERFDTQYFVNNREWEFFKNKAVRRETELPWGMKSSQVKYEFTLKRRASVDNDDDKESSASQLISVPLLLIMLCMLV